VAIKRNCSEESNLFNVGIDLTCFTARGGQGRGHHPKLTNQEKTSPHIASPTSAKGNFIIYRLDWLQQAVELSKHGNE
jgi:hypothetical protein